MAMQKPGQGAIVDIGDNAYLFPSQAGGQVTDCFILAHGGTPSGTKLKDYYFTIPAGCEVNFFSAGGMNNKLPGSGGSRWRLPRDLRLGGQPKLIEE